MTSLEVQSRLAKATQTRILELAATVYDGANDSHLAELTADAGGAYPAALPTTSRSAAHRGHMALAGGHMR